MISQAKENSLGRKYGTSFCSAQVVRPTTSKGHLSLTKEELNGTDILVIPRWSDVTFEKRL